MDISVVVAAREDDRPPAEALAVSEHADRLGFGELWIGEGPTWDAFTLATAVGLATGRIAMTVGPLPVSVRDPATIARGAASVAALTGRAPGIALGTSSVRVVEGLHGRSRAGAVDVIERTAAALRAQAAGGGPEPHGSDTLWRGFRQRLTPARGPLTVAAFGPRAIAVAARHADRMLLDLVSPDQVATLRERLHAVAHDVGRPPPRLVAWLPAAVDPAPESIDQIISSIAGYLVVRGYGEMFAAAGFGRAVELARTGAAPGDVLNALPREAASTVGLVGDVETVRKRLTTYAGAGLDEVAVVPATSGDPGGQRTLTALATI